MRQYLRVRLVASASTAQELAGQSVDPKGK